ncbi:hypothetical protein GCM10023148_22150 [Actinokineospora soli]
MPRPLACLTDETLADEVLRLAASATCDVDRAADRVELSARWTGPPLVLVDDPETIRGLPRRDGVLVLHPGTPSTAFLSAAFDAGATRVVCLPDDTPWLSGALADAAESTPGRTGPVIAVVGGSGGAGASIFATTLALTSINAGTPALLIDCDPLSGGLDLVLGTESKEGLRWPDIPTTTGRVSATKLKQALPGRAKNGTRLTLLSGTHTGEGPAPDAVEAVIAAGRRTGDTVICDLPRHPTPAMRTALSAANLVAVVVQADVRSCAAAHRITTDLRHHGVRLGVVVRGPSPSKLSPQEIAQTLATPLLAHYTTDRDLPPTLDRGDFHPKGSLTRAARKLLRDLTQ